MSIRWKFLLSYAAMLVVPLLLLIITAMLMSIVYHGDVQSLKSTYESKFEGMEENDTRNLIKHAFLQNTDLLTDTAFLNELSADMLKRNTLEENQVITYSSCNCPGSRRRRLMNTKANAISARIIPSTRNPSKLNLPPITIPINNEERMVPRYLDVLNNPDATPIISFGVLWNKAACIPTLFNPLLIPNAAKARHTLITGEV